MKDKAFSPCSMQRCSRTQR